MVETTPIINMIDPSYTPQYKSGPKRILILLFGTIIVGFLGTVFIVLREFLANPAFRPRNLDSLLMHVRSYR